MCHGPTDQPVARQRKHLGPKTRHKPHPLRLPPQILCPQWVAKRIGQLIRRISQSTFGIKRQPAAIRFFDIVMMQVAVQGANLGHTCQHLTRHAPRALHIAAQGVATPRPKPQIKQGLKLIPYLGQTIQPDIGPQYALRDLSQQMRSTSVISAPDHVPQRRPGKPFHQNRSVLSRKNPCSTTPVQCFKQGKPRRFILHVAAMVDFQSCRSTFRPKHLPNRGNRSLGNNLRRSKLPLLKKFRVYLPFQTGSRFSAKARAPSS